jgi:hypothetical protein
VNCFWSSLALAAHFVHLIVSFCTNKICDLFKREVWWMYLSIDLIDDIRLQTHQELLQYNFSFAKGSCVQFIVIHTTDLYWHAIPQRHASLTISSSSSLLCESHLHWSQCSNWSLINYSGKLLGGSKFLTTLKELVEWGWAWFLLLSASNDEIWGPVDKLPGGSCSRKGIREAPTEKYCKG